MEEQKLTLRVRYRISHMGPPVRHKHNLGASVQEGSPAPSTKPD